MVMDTTLLFAKYEKSVDQTVQRNYPDQAVQNLPHQNIGYKAAVTAVQFDDLDVEHPLTDSLSFGCKEVPLVDYQSNDPNRHQHNSQNKGRV